MIDIRQFDFRTKSPNPAEDPTIEKYNSIILSGKGDILREIFIINPHFNLLLFSDKEFNEDFIKVYGLKFLVKNYLNIDSFFLELCRNYPQEKIETSLNIYNSFKYNMNTDLLYKIIKLNPDIKLYEIKSDIYQPLFIQHYGLKFLVENNGVLNYNILNAGFNNRKLLKCLMNNHLPIQSYLLDSPLMSVTLVNEIEELSKDKLKREFLTHISDLNDVEILENEKDWNIIKTFISYFDIEQVVCNLQTILSITSIKNIFYIAKLLNVLPSDLSNFISFCYLNKLLIDDIGYSKLTDSQIDYLKKYYKIPSRLKMRIDCAEDLDNFESIKMDALEQYIMDKKLINVITLGYTLSLVFGDDNIIQRAESALSVLRSNKIHEEYYPYLEDIISISNCSDNVSLFNIIKKILNYNYSMDNIESYTKRICKFDLCDSLTIFDKSLKIVKLEGQNFKLLVHKIKGLTNREMGNRLNDDISNWDNYPDHNSLISTSLIDQYYIGILPGVGYTLGFNDLNSNHVLDMGPSDIYSEPISGKEYHSTSKSCFMMADDLLRKSLNGYNEIVLKRFIQRKECRPNFVLSQNMITPGDHHVASYFNVPIYVLDIEKYIILMKEHLNQMMNNLNLDNYSIYLLQSFLSSYADFELAKKYFNIKVLDEETNKIINFIKNEINQDNRLYLRTKLNKIIDTYTRISDMMFSQGISSSLDYEACDYKILTLSL